MWFCALERSANRHSTKHQLAGSCFGVCARWIGRIIYPPVFYLTALQLPAHIWNYNECNQSFRVQQSLEQYVNSQVHGHKARSFLEELVASVIATAVKASAGKYALAVRNIPLWNGSLKFRSCSNQSHYYMTILETTYWSLLQHMWLLRVLLMINTPNISTRYSLPAKNHACE